MRNENNFLHIYWLRNDYECLNLYILLYIKLCFIDVFREFLNQDIVSPRVSKALKFVIIKESIDNHMA